MGTGKEDAIRVVVEQNLNLYNIHLLFVKFV